MAWSGSFAIIHLPIVPQKIELPEVAMQILAADVVIDAYESTPNQGVATLGGINVHIIAAIKAAEGKRLMYREPITQQREYTNVREQKKDGEQLEPF